MGVLAWVCTAAAVLAPTASALYSASGPVTELTESNFETKLKRGAWLVEFYAPWCGHCKALVPEWRHIPIVCCRSPREKAAKGLSGIVGVGALDADQHKSLAGQHGVRGFPTIKFMYHDGKAIKAVDYKGGRTAKEIITFGMDKAKALALKRIGEKASKSSGTSSGTGSSGGGGGFYPSSSKVVTLSEDNFATEVRGSDDLWLIEFYAPWCGHCQQLKPKFIDAAKQLDGKTKLGAVNCDEEKQLCSEFGIQGFPTLKFFGKNKSRPSDYEGGREAADMVSFCTQQWSKNAPPPEVVELTGPEVFKKHCTGEGDGDAKQLCVLAFLPDILDSKAEGRKLYIAVLQKMAEHFKDRPYSYLWAAGGAHSELEGNVGVGGFGYPALVALSPAKGVYVPHKGALIWEQAREFVGSIRTGAKAAMKLQGQLAQPASVSPWDGKDGAEPEVEEMSLDDIMNS